MGIVKMPINGYHTDDEVFVLLDEEDYEWCKQWKWQQGSSGYARRNVSFRDSNGKIKWRTVQMHRAILGIDGMYDGASCVDHINGNRLDNRKENLRIVDLSTNSSNRHTVLSSTGHLRVTEQSGHYMARIRTKKNSVYLGSYASIQEAEKALDLYREKKILLREIKRARPVVQIDADGTRIKVFTNCGEAARATGIASSNISRCANGNRKTAGGYFWEFQR